MICFEDECCFICGSEKQLELHHIFGGANRKKADDDGLTVYLVVIVIEKVGLACISLQKWHNSCMRWASSCGLTIIRGVPYETFQDVTVGIIYVTTIQSGKRNKQMMLTKKRWLPPSLFWVAIRICCIHHICSRSDEGCRQRYRGIRCRQANH